MYLKNIPPTDSEFIKKLSSYNLTHKEFKTVKQILTMPTKSWVLAWKQILHDLWIVNWLWPAYFPKLLRSFLGWLLFDIDWFFHDLGILLARDKFDVLEADRGVKKYGFKSIYKKTIEREDKFELFPILLDFFILVPLKSLVVYIVYWLLRIWSRFSTNF